MVSATLDSFQLARLTFGCSVFTMMMLMHAESSPGGNDVASGDAQQGRAPAQVLPSLRLQSVSNALHLPNS